MRSGQRSLSFTLLALTAGAALSACSGGGGGGGEFAITSINLNNGAVWRINRPIKVTFSRPVDFSSVNLNTFNVRRVGGGPAAGEFYLENNNQTVVFQPLCPTQPDLSDAGLTAGQDPNNNDLPYQYELNIIGVDQNSALPIRGTNGDALASSQSRQFTTPVSLNPLDLYLDTKVGPPIARVIGDQPDTDISNGTHIEIGGPGGQKYYFERNNGVLSINPPIDLPLNKLSEPDTQVALIIGFDQAISPYPVNIASDRIRWEFQNDVGAWVPLATRVVLENNCTRTGARVRVSPLGLLPPSATVRAVLTPEFSDIVGETNAVQQNNFAVADTEAFPTNPPQLYDHFLEDFDTNINEDTSASFAEPKADWGNGELSAKFSFSGTGGPDGNFDWYIGPTESVIFNTANSTIRGYHLTFNSATDDTIASGEGQQVSQQTVVGGVVDIDDFYIEAGGLLKIEGPNPFVMMASGRVVVRGRIDVGGTSSNGVNTLNTTNVPEPGSPGQAGGGKGGTGSPLTTASSPKGGNGFGAFNVADLGGGGGETGWSVLGGVAARRGAGGGGGRLGSDQLAPAANQTANCTPNCAEQRRIGFDGEPGFGSAADNGALSGSAGPFGGAAGPQPFGDPDPSNNFFGQQYSFGPGNPVTVGELTRPWAGAGGGAGGDASRVTGGSFPPPWNPQGDEKGSGGAGGGGSFHLLALEHISFGVNGILSNRGGIGGGGENTNFVDRVGGGSGGGSGGYVILQTSSYIDFSAKQGVVWNTANDNNWAIDCRGGQGGAGSGDIGGGSQSPTGQKETQPSQDACPPGYPTTGTNACRGQIDGAGGDGGPGIIQLHTSEGKYGASGSLGVDIYLPTGGATIDQVCAPMPLAAIPSTTAPTATAKMIPTFGRLSRARSDWIALGEGGFDPNSPTYKDVLFAFGGVDPVTGLVETTGSLVDALPPLLGPSALDLNGIVPPFVVTPGGFQLVMDATPLAGTAWVDNTALLEHYLIELNNGVTLQRFDVVTAAYDSGTQRLTLTIDGDGPSMLDFNITVGTTAALQPAYFRVRTSGTPDFLPSSATVQITMEATSADPLTGLPDANAILGPTSDVSVLNAPPNGDLRFVRFNVLFDIAATGGQLSEDSPIPSLEFFRLPFSYQ